MDMNFFESFPTIDRDNELGAAFERATVTKISTNKDKTVLRVYITLDSLIPRKYITSMEQTLTRQLHFSDDFKVIIKETFTLSDTYDAQAIYEQYEDSIKSELREISQVLYNLYSSSKIEISGNNITLHLVDNLVYSHKTDDLINFLYNVYKSRCGLDVNIDFKYDHVDDSIERIKKDNDKMVENMVNRIIANSSENRAKAKSEELLISTDNSEQQNNTNTTPKKDNSTPVQKGQSNQSTNKSSNNSYNNYKTKSPFKPRSGGEDYVSDNPDVIYGRELNADAEVIPISSIDESVSNCIIRGKIIANEMRELRSGEKVLFIITITDFTDSISVKVFSKTERAKDLSKKLSDGNFIKVSGIATEDKYDRQEISITSVNSIMSIPKFAEREKRSDDYATKRVELHCHTKFSDMDGVSDVEAIVAAAADYGHKAIAITDHGNIQAFPVAFHHMPKGSDIKILFGVEGYLVDDERMAVVNPKDFPLQGDTCVFDLETTGLSPKDSKIIEIGAVKISDGKIVDRFSTFVNPERPIPFRITELTKIRDDMVKEAPVIEQALPLFLEFCKDCVLVGHNAQFDVGFIEAECDRLHLNHNFTSIDTMMLSRTLLPKMKKYTLDKVAKELHIPFEGHHRAVNDAEVTAEIYLRYIKRLTGEKQITNVNEINDKLIVDDATIASYHAYHIILIAKNETGRVNLNKLISDSHLIYFNNRPKMPKSLIRKHREGIIISSACEAGELYEAIEFGKSDAEIAKIASFYDYLEVQPLGNNRYKLFSEKSPVETNDDLIRINKEIIALGETLGKPVVATSDVHFLNPEDSIYRTIIQAARGYDDAETQPPLFLHTTEEMLNEFSYLDYDKAYEIVVTNSNLIADMCDRIDPVRPDKAPPVIENSDKDLRDICYKKAHEIYGPDLPEQVKARLDRELNSIISNGYAVMYIIAQKLVWDSNDHGYLVGSRGSVGSSFAATMSGITEVNPLPAHYLCPECYYCDFDSDEVKEYVGRGGCDMPDKNCPNCGHPLDKHGFDIPFETFLGFKGNKEPDIDLNFSGEYQGKAHRYTEVIFGTGQTFKAGTVSGVAEKTAIGYVRNYYKDKGLIKRNCEIARQAKKIEGIRRTTGQHPGGIVVLPRGENIYSFTPIQHPANDMTTDIKTTHFEYHSIDHNLLKLDILGHDDPTMIRRLEDLTGIDSKTIKFDDPDVMSLFQNLDALGLTPKDIGGTKLGALGIPEFGTDFAMGMLIDTKPKEFSDLARIAGLSHGTDVWLGNAQDLILSGTATISECICTRDDIMTYLISKGVESEKSFKIMENVRKGVIAKGKCEQWSEWKQDMIDHDVPDWYIKSCEKIKYMFPKAHAVAYVMMAWRIAYFKIHYPLAYYAAFFSIRANGFKYEYICMGREKFNYYISELRRRSNSNDKAEMLSNAEEETLKTMRLAEEMLARGYDFMPIDIYVADAKDFKIIDGKLMAPLNTLDGMGDGAAETAAAAAKEGKFLSREDFKNRAKVSQTVVDNMNDLGLFGNLTESNQISLFDFL